MLPKKLREGALATEAKVGGDLSDGRIEVQHHVARSLDSGLDEKILHAESEDLAKRSA